MHTYNIYEAVCMYGRVCIVACMLLCAPVFALAQTSCGGIIASPDFYNPWVSIESGAIEDCSDPFGVSTDQTSPYTLIIEEQEVGDDVVEVPIGGTTNVRVEGTTLLSSVDHLFFFHDGDDYVLVDTRTSEPTEDDYREIAEEYFPSGTDVEPYVLAILNNEFDFDTEEEENTFWDFYDYFYDQYVPEIPPLREGVYTLVSKEYMLVVTQASIFERLAEFFIPIAHAQDAWGEYTFTFTFEIREVEPEPEIDPLLLRYAPTLYMHPDEDYLPMNVEAFVEGSALWDDGGVSDDIQLLGVGDVSIDVLDSYNDTEDFYLAFSAPNESKSLDLEASREKYDEMVADGIAETTFYARRMEDSYQDSQGETHEFIVLQYWYFYAMNNWREHGGQNNHEGDWESVFVFLDKDTEYPKYVAFSAHHNDGEEGFNPSQYGSVRREWDSGQIEIDGSSVSSYVALGSHANYPKVGEYRAVLRIDYASSAGEEIEFNDFTDAVDLSVSPSWLEYEGKWGSDGILLGEDGPQGPTFTEVSGHRRFANPLTWAGIDAIDEFVSTEDQVVFDFSSSGIQMMFTTPIPAGTRFSTVPYAENISFGTVPPNTEMLPRYWDIESSLSNGTFEVEVELPFDTDDLESLDASPSQLRVYWYNPDTDGWEKQTTTLSEADSTVSFTTSHFSRYALGAEDESEPTLEQSESSSSGSRNGTSIKRVDDTLFAVAEVSITNEEIQKEKQRALYSALAGVLEYMVERYEVKGYLTEGEVKQIRDLLDSIAEMVEKDY